MAPAHCKTKAFGDALDADGNRVAMLAACDDARGYDNCMEKYRMGWGGRQQKGMRFHD
jgi:hypothetical protein